MLPLGQASAQGDRGDVDELDLVGGAEEWVGDAFVLDAADDRADDVAQRFEVLDVDRREHVDPGSEDRRDVLPPLLPVPGAGDVRVGEFVDDDELGRSGEHRLGVEFLEGPPLVGHLGARQGLEPLRECRGVGAAVVLDDADDDVAAGALGPSGGFEHRHGLADSGCIPEEDRELPRRGEPISSRDPRRRRRCRGYSAGRC